MSFERLAQGGLDYQICRYAGSGLQFRGPARDLSGDYIAFLGGTETYGRFVKSPFPALIERETGLTCVNFGQVNAGADAYLNDPGMGELTRRARLAVLQLPGAINLSNGFYTVHPRRNDRLIEATARLRRLYPEVDFTAFHFTRHLLGRLQEIDARRFEQICTELRAAWISRLTLLLERLGTPAILLWFSDHPPRPASAPANIARNPALITRPMIARLAAQVVEVVISAKALGDGTRSMHYALLESAAAVELPGPAGHAEAAQSLIPAITDRLARKAAI